MQILQNIYDRRNISGVAVASDWIADKVTVRESHHAPYRFVMAFSRVKIFEMDDDQVSKENEEEKENHFKELLLSGNFFRNILGRKLSSNYTIVLKQDENCKTGLSQFSSIKFENSHNLCIFLSELATIFRNGRPSHQD